MLKSAIPAQPENERVAPSDPRSQAAEQRLARLSLRWLRVIAGCLILLSIIAFGVILSTTRAVTMPVVAGIVVGLIIGPIGDRAKGFGLPRAVSYFALIVVLVGGFFAAVSAILPAFDTLASALPQLKERLGAVSARLETWLGGAPLIVGRSAALDQATMIDWASKALSFLTPALSQGLIFLFTLILFLAGRADIRRSLTLAIKGREKRLAALKTLSNVENRLTDYFLTVSLINAGFAACIWLVFLVLGVEQAARWAALAFLLNYLPVVGPLLIKTALLGYALVFAPGVVSGLAPLAFFLSLSLIEANVVTPKIISTRMTMNPLLVFLSVIFWTWLWGFPGAFLAMPFLAIGSAIHAENSAAKAPALPG